MSDTLTEIRRRLMALSPEHLELLDDSARHAGHEGARGGGGHYELFIVSAAFEGLPTIARHRKVYATLGDLMAQKIHALSIKAQTPAEAGRNP